MEEKRGIKTQRKVWQGCREVGEWIGGVMGDRE